MPIDQEALAGILELDSEQPGLLKQLVELFINLTPQYIAKMKTAFSENDAKKLRIEAHTLKSSSASLGAMSISALCKELQEMGDAGDIRQASEKIALLEREFEAAQAELKTLAGIET
ncbi:Hpt domain-containing protein [Bdellovibrionota bacterium FG-2]